MYCTCSLGRPCRGVATRRIGVASFVRPFFTVNPHRCSPKILEFRGTRPSGDAHAFILIYPLSTSGFKLFRSISVFCGTVWKCLHSFPIICLYQYNPCMYIHAYFHTLCPYLNIFTANNQPIAASCMLKTACCIQKLYIKNFKASSFGFFS